MASRALSSSALSTLLSAAVALALCGCGQQTPEADSASAPVPSEPASEEAPIELAYSISFPASHRQYETAVAWAREVEKRTGGRVAITTHPDDALTQAPRCFEEVLKGASDIGMTSFASTPGRFPLLEGLDMPLGYPSGAAASRIAADIVAKYDPEELSDVHLLYVHAHGPGMLASRKAVRTLDNMAGLKVRATGVPAKIVEALGGIPATLGQAETYEALQKGSVEATWCPIETLKEWKQGEVIAYVVDTSPIACTTAMFVVMNKAKWQALPEDVRQVIGEVSAQWTAKHGAAWDKADDEGRAFVEGLGREIIRLPGDEQARWKAAVQPVLDEYVARTHEKQLPGEVLLENVRAALAQ
ncbi:MAG TPA: TRAP transporter substrate-binding protein [Candidatus Hydrogenedentes bacterium]|nr:TRAP transporter substrate-binding protein [Candidatus Hydrogenedentota bacterium]